MFTPVQAFDQPASASALGRKEQKTINDQRYQSQSSLKKWVETITIFQ
jgi:hypothetical protein